MALFTLTELDEQIAAWKKGLLALATSIEYKMESGGTVRVLKRSESASYWTTLKLLESERAMLVGGTSAPSRRTYAKQGGRD